MINLSSGSEVNTKNTTKYKILGGPEKTCQILIAYIPKATI